MESFIKQEPLDENEWASLFGRLQEDDLDLTNAFEEGSAALNTIGLDHTSHTQERSTSSTQGHQGLDHDEGRHHNSGSNPQNEVQALYVHQTSPSVLSLLKAAIDYKTIWSTSIKADNSAED